MKRSDDRASPIGKRSVLLAGHKTSISVELAFWIAAKELAADRGQSMGSFLTEIDRQRSSGRPRSASTSWNTTESAPRAAKEAAVSAISLRRMHHGCCSARRHERGQVAGTAAEPHAVPSVVFLATHALEFLS